MKSRIYAPPIKSQGIKTKLVPWINSIIPEASQGIKTKLVPWINSIIPEAFTGTWIEPFMGTGVVAFNVCPKSAIMGDSNPHLINFYMALQKDEITPEKTKSFLKKEGMELL